jgi:hypothetical protein
MRNQWVSPPLFVSVVVWFIKDDGRTRGTAPITAKMYAKRLLQSEKREEPYSKSYTLQHPSDVR